MSEVRLVVDPIACDGHGLCHELFPEGVDVDDWGYPIVIGGRVERAQVRNARRAVSACPRLALRLVEVAAADSTGRTR